MKIRIEYYPEAVWASDTSDEMPTMIEFASSIEEAEESLGRIERYIKNHPNE